LSGSSGPVGGGDAVSTVPQTHATSINRCAFMNPIPQSVCHILRAVVKTEVPPEYVLLRDFLTKCAIP
jgi:hypothetical protein